MKSTRRNFLTTGLAAVGTSALLDSSAAAETDTIECLDYGRSFICNTATANAVRFWVESRTILYDDKAGTQLVIYQCGSGAVSVVTSFRGSLVDGWLGIGGLWAVGRLLMR